jgi:hypothetical protein
MEKSSGLSQLQVLSAIKPNYTKKDSDIIATAGPYLRRRYLKGVDILLNVLWTTLLRY